jgi:hypothetical protein
MIRGDDMLRNLRTDEQFEQAYVNRSTICARDPQDDEASLIIGSLDSFNPILVTIAGTVLERNQFDFMTLR